MEINIFHLGSLLIKVTMCHKYIWKFPFYSQICPSLTDKICCCPTMNKCTPSSLNLTRPYLLSALIQHPPHGGTGLLSDMLPSLILRQIQKAPRAKDCPEDIITCTNCPPRIDFVRLPSEWNPSLAFGIALSVYLGSGKWGWGETRWEGSSRIWEWAG